MENINDSSEHENNEQAGHPPNYTVNKYTTQKTISNGAINVALLSNNAHELRLLIQKEEADKDGLYYVTFTLVCISLLLQLLALILSCYVGYSDVNHEDTQDGSKITTRHHIHRNNTILTVLSVSYGLITFVNVIIKAIADT